jgi:hypothetical protein
MSFGRIILFLFCVYLAPGAMVCMWHAICHLGEVEPRWHWIAGGCLVGALTEFVLRQLIPGYATFFHELDHMLVAIAAQKSIRRFIVTAHNGGCVVTSEHSEFALTRDLVSLAPYYLALLPLSCAFIVNELPQDARPYGLGVFGLLLGRHLAKVVGETKWNWHSHEFKSAHDGTPSYTDIAKCGFAHAALVIVVLNVLAMGLSCYVVCGSEDLESAKRTTIVAVSNSVYRPVWEWCAENVQWAADEIESRCGR